MTIIWNVFTGFAVNIGKSNVWLRNRWRVIVYTFFTKYIFS